MKSASKNWVLIVITFFLFNCGSTSETVIEPIKKHTPLQKALVLVRTEGSKTSINQFKETLNSDFINNNISTNITIYSLGRPWNNNQIFTTAYNDNYDYIIIMDQVAKFSIDGKTQVGGKYQIRSYHLKSKNPDWLDLGQKTCNISVKPSVNKFSSQVVSSIVPNYKPLKDSIEDETYASTNQENNQYNSFKSSKEVDNEIAELKRQLKIEQQKTNDALAEKERLEKQYEIELALEKEKTQQALASLDNAKKDVEAKKRLNLIEKEKALALVEAKRKEEDKRLQKELEKQLKEQQAIATANSREQKRLAKENKQRKKAQEDQLLKQQLKESQRLVKVKEESERLKKLTQLKQEQEIAEANSKEQKRLAKESKLIKEQEAAFEKQQLKERNRLAKKEAKRIEEETRVLARVNENKRLALKKKNTELKKQKEAIALTKRKKTTHTPIISNNKRIKNPGEKTNALVIIKGKTNNSDNFKKLKTNIEFDFLFAKAKANTLVYSEEKIIDKSNILSTNNNYDIVIIVNQLDYLGDGLSNYSISSFNHLTTSKWVDQQLQAFNTSDRESTKKLSKTIVKTLQ